MQTVYFLILELRLGNYNLIESIQKIIYGLKGLFIESFGILPKYLFLTILVISILLFIVFITLKKCKFGEKLLSILKLIYIALVLIIVTMLPQVMLSTESIWIVSRSSYAIASLIAIIWLYLYLEVKNTKIIDVSLVLILCIYLVIQYVGYQNISRDHYIVNYMDHYICNQINNEILKYESETGNTVSKVVFYRDMNPSCTYQGITSYGDTNIKASYPEWSVGALLNNVIGRNLQQVYEKDKNIEETFNKNWDFYSNEQVKFCGDTMHLCIF